MSFATNIGDVSTDNRSNLHELQSNPINNTQLQLELATTVDVGDFLLRQRAILMEMSP